MIETRTQAQEFVQTVQRMRELQKQYFRQRDSLTLSACKKAEKAVDELIWIYAEKPTDRPVLF